MVRSDRCRSLFKKKEEKAAEHDIVTCMDSVTCVYSVANMYSVDAPPYIVKLKETDWTKRCLLCIQTLASRPVGIEIHRSHTIAAGTWSISLSYALRDGSHGEPLEKRAI